MKNSTYWQKRFEELERAMDQYGQDAYRMIEPAFDEAAKEINLQIEKWVNRVAVNNEISMTNARKLLKANQLEEFHWTVEEYIKYGKENAINQQWLKQLENASAKIHIQKLEALKLQAQQAAEVAFGNYLDGVDDMVRNVYLEGYYRSAFEIQKGVGVGWSLDAIDEDKLSKLVSKPWAADGRNFSDRIWQSKAQMVSELHNELTRACIMGKGPDQAINNLSKYVNKKFKSAKTQAARLVMTEQAFFSSAAQKDGFNDLGVEEYEIVATLDSHTSEICQELDGQHFPMPQYDPGSTAPPFHVWCRSTTCPYFDDEFTAGEMRAARDADGKTYYVPADMKYPEWRRQFVESDSKNEPWKQKAQEFIAKSKKEYPPGPQMPTGGDTLSDADIYALHRYMSSECYPLNKKLRNQLPLTSDEQALIRSIDNAILKLPQYEGVVYRSLSLQAIDDLEGFNKEHQIGFPVRYDAYTSTGTSVYDEGMEIQLIIESKNGRDMRDLNKPEQEVVFKRGSAFGITKRKGNKIWMTEL